MSGCEKFDFETGDTPIAGGQSYLVCYVVDCKERMSTSRSQNVLAMPTPASMERHFSVAQVAEAWDLSADAVRRLFANEPGVLVLEPPTRSHFSRRRYRTLRIPAAVLDRVYRRLSVSPATQNSSKECKVK